LTTATFRWPRRSEVFEAARRWALLAAAQNAPIKRIGVIGSFADGRFGVGSDLDLIVLLDGCDEPFGSRLPNLDDRGLPVPADILIYTEAELAAMRGQGRRLAKLIEESAEWLFVR
jgi:predicted nucleotidyltransferase